MAAASPSVNSPPGLPGRPGERFGRARGCAARMANRDVRGGGWGVRRIGVAMTDQATTVEAIKALSMTKACASR